jgi:ATP-dependent RNA helicase RhlE
MSVTRREAGHAGTNLNTLNPTNARESDSSSTVADGVEETSSECVFNELIPELRRALADTGYSEPTPVQSQCIPPLAAGRDLLGSAQTGTGKTAAFTLPLLQYVASHPRERVRRTPRVLILAPTRELAAQIGESIRTYSSHLKISHTVVFGGVGQRPQERAMSRGIDFLVATPGRLLDLMGQGLISVREVEAFVLDEADRMLDMGFIRDIRKVIDQLPERRQTLFFSATISPEIVSLSKSMLKNPVRVTIAPEQPTVERIEQKVMFVDKGNKDSLLVSLLKGTGVDKVIVFAQMKHVANKVAERLEKSGISAGAIHGNKSQGARTRALEGFKAGRVRVLVATDIAARGIDVDGITHVINYHLPIEAETYVHRIGRTARAGLDGDAVSFCSASERDQLRDIERLIRKPIPVDDQHSYHSESAANAVGAEARPAARGQGGSRNQGRGRSDGPGRGGKKFAGGGKGGFRSRRSGGRAMRSGRR